MGYIYNTNNCIYKIVEKSGEYMLLQNIEDKFTPFVIACGYNEATYSWGSGEYFATFEEANEKFKKIVGS